jgi:hypothetical protein
MARGWESKSVEEQQSEATRPPSGGDQQTPEQARLSAQIQTLELQRARVRQQLQQAENPRFIELLQRELEHLDAQLTSMRESKARS